MYVCTYVRILYSMYVCMHIILFAYSWTLYLQHAHEKNESKLFTTLDEVRDLK